MRIIIIGSGYVGLVSGACLAELGHEVLCVDTDLAKIARLKAGDIPIFEPKLAEMIRRNGERDRLRFADCLPAFGPEIDAVFIAVGTPPLANGGGANLEAVFGAARDIAAKAKQEVLVVIKSTVPAGTGDAVERLLRREQPALLAVVASNPEFLREGNAIADFMEPDRIVIGTDDVGARQTLSRLYTALADIGTPLLQVGRRAAELTKYAANAFLAIKIAFINEVADLCEAIDADIDQVARGVGLDGRIGQAFLEAGPGYGGSCFPKDSAALLATAQDHAVSLRLIESTIAANDARKRAMGRRVAAAMGGEVAGRVVGVLGLTFKPNTDDIRDAPALALISSLERAGARVRVYDPRGMDNARNLLPGVTFTTSPYHCAEGADCLVLATQWVDFSALDAARLARLMRAPLLVDLRNSADAARFAEAGFAVHGIGRRPRLPPARPVSMVLRRTAGRFAPPSARPLNGAVPAPSLPDASPLSGS